MKAIMVMFDSLNRHMLPPYGCSWVHAPNFARLAERTVTFDRAYVGSMPCMPARRELHTGRYNFLHRSWGPLEPFDDSMPEILRQNGVYSHLVTDHYHYFEDGGGTYHPRFSTWEFERGQEGDPWKGFAAEPHIPETVAPRDARIWRQDWINREYMQTEADQPQPRTFERGIDFIRSNAGRDHWFLQLETFDPHEPFFTQQHYKDLYPHQYDGPHFDWPPYRMVDETPDQIEHVRYEYAALVSMCDHYLGRVLDVMDELNLWDDTLLIVNTDHGFLLGEHDWWAKVVQPFYDEIAHIPLFIWDPRCKRQGERCDVLVQTIDLAPTILEFFDIDRPPAMLGQPLRETVAHNQPVREAGLFGIHGGHMNCTDGRYVYMLAPLLPENQPLFEYTMMPTRMNRQFSVDELQDIQLAEPFTFTKGCRTMKIAGRAAVDYHAFGTLLFDMAHDPQQLHPLHDPAVEARMKGLIVALLAQNDAPPEQYQRFGFGLPLPENQKSATI